jgi:hypothetical protein
MTAASSFADLRLKRVSTVSRHVALRPIDAQITGRSAAIRGLGCRPTRLLTSESIGRKSLRGKLGDADDGRAVLLRVVELA